VEHIDNDKLITNVQSALHTVMDGVTSDVQETITNGLAPIADQMQSLARDIPHDLAQILSKVEQKETLEKLVQKHLSTIQELEKRQADQKQHQHQLKLKLEDTEKQLELVKKEAKQYAERTKFLEESIHDHGRKCNYVDPSEAPGLAPKDT